MKKIKLLSKISKNNKKWNKIMITTDRQAYATDGVIIARYNFIQESSDFMNNVTENIIIDTKTDNFKNYPIEYIVPRKELHFYSDNFPKQEKMDEILDYKDENEIKIKLNPKKLETLVELYSEYPSIEITINKNNKKPIKIADKDNIITSAIMQMN